MNMKKAIFLVVGILIISGFAAGGITNIVNVETKVDYYSVDDISARQVLAAMNPELGGKLPLDIFNNKATSGRDYPIGDTIWQYTLTIYDPSPKAIAPIEDINGDDIDDVIVTSEDDYVRCFDGGAIGTGSWIWEHEIYAGDIYSQKGLDIIEDVDGDGYEDVVVGAVFQDIVEQQSGRMIHMNMVAVAGFIRLTAAMITMVMEQLMY